MGVAGRLSMMSRVLHLLSGVLDLLSLLLFQGRMLLQFLGKMMDLMVG